MEAILASGPFHFPIDIERPGTVRHAIQVQAVPRAYTNDPDNEGEEIRRWESSWLTLQTNAGRCGGFVGVLRSFTA